MPSPTAPDSETCYCSANLHGCSAKAPHARLCRLPALCQARSLAFGVLLRGSVSSFFGHLNIDWHIS